MSTQLQQVIQRLHLVGPDGEIYRPRARLLAVLNVLAGAIFSEEMERGCTHSISAISKQSGKGRRTVQTALREAVQCGLVRIAEVHIPVFGQRASRYWLDKRLCDAAELPKPWQGGALLYMSPDATPAKQGGDTEARAQRAYRQHNTRKKHMPRPQQTGVQLLHPDYKDPAPALDVQAPGVLPLPQGGGGAGCFEQPKGGLIDQSVFFDFFQNLEVEADFQPRLVRGQRAGQRGARLWKVMGGDPRTALGSATTALERLKTMEDYLGRARGKKRLEGVLHAVGDHPILLVDDLDHDQVAALTDWWAGPMLTIQTSPGNHQALLRATVVLTHDQRTTIQRALVVRFGGDVGAANGSQLHRYPGSMNFKNGGSWCTRLTSARSTGRGDAGVQVEALLAQHHEQTGSRPAVTQNAGPATGDPSRAAFVHALVGLRRGVPTEQLVAHIAAVYNTSGKHTRGRDEGIGWARRTVNNAVRKSRV